MNSLLTGRHDDGQLRLIGIHRRSPMEIREAVANAILILDALAHKDSFALANVSKTDLGKIMASLTKWMRDTRARKAYFLDVMTLVEQWTGEKNGD